ncbi:MAG TPA: hypothetical protein PKC26_05870, partial [Plasticicumulans sp.]|nr:hypothetical protein [Plasticicumulans sp.]
TAPAPAPASPADGRGRVERFTWNRNSGAAAVGGWATAAIGQVQTPGRFPLKGNPFCCGLNQFPPEHNRVRSWT